MKQKLATPKINPLPDDLSSPQAKLVYLYLEATGGATLDDLNETLAMKKIAILSVLNSLTSRGLVDTDGSHYVASN